MSTLCRRQGGSLRGRDRRRSRLPAADCARRPPSSKPGPPCHVPAALPCAPGQLRSCQDVGARADSDATCVSGLCPRTAVGVAAKALETNMTRLGPLVLPWSGEAAAPAPSVAARGAVRPRSGLAAGCGMSRCRCLPDCICVLDLAPVECSAAVASPNWLACPAEKLMFAANWVARKVFR